MLSEAAMKQWFADGFAFPPLMIRLGSADSKQLKHDRIDALLTVTSQNQTFDFAAEFKSRSSPRIFDAAIIGIERAANLRGMMPMLVVPYLRESQLDELQRRQLSGIDLCGNGVITVPGSLFVYRTGARNKFPESAPTKYAYRGATSLVARAFLCRAAYQSLADIADEIKRRGGSVVLSTISKAIKRLEDDLIVDRTDAGFITLQPERLLQKLSESYTPPKLSKVVTLKLKTPPKDSDKRPLSTGAQVLASLALDQIEVAQSRIVLTGESSIENYAVMGRQDWPVFYTSDADALIKEWGKKVEQTSRYVDFELRQTNDPTVYFDIRTKQNLPCASPIQVYLECTAGDKRERQTALQIQELMLRELQP